MNSIKFLALKKRNLHMNSVPQWLKKSLTVNESFFETKKVLAGLSINTVCESARCPNLNECFSKNFATFMILGNACTRGCAFCSVRKGKTELLDTDEPEHVAACVKRLGLKYVIVTSVTRDDLDDGGAGQFLKTVNSVKRVSKCVLIELLIPDFSGNINSIKTVALSGADIIGHNIETVKKLYPIIRKDADYSGSLDILRLIKEINAKVLTKSAILAGLGETEEEIIRAMEDLREVNCDILTIGQYLRPSEENHPVQRFVTPEEFARLRKYGIDMGFRQVSAGPFVRSSYLAEETFPKEVYMTNVTLPPLAEGVDKAGISFWFKQPGEEIKTGEDLVELVTDKATFKMPSPATGKLKEILVNEGDSAQVGQTIAIIE